MAQRPLVRFLFALLLVSAQHAALAHPLWHFSDAPLPPAEQALCFQHGALDSVGSAVGCGSAATEATAAPASAPESIAPPEAPAPGISPTSRSPPALP